ncbi:uncharacterized protein TNCV_4090211 [Trichonephila clavipes]|uniref:Transposase n=1 Tax=Trichonephila clavipes TaxID=2585209 RepID=A0A8X6VBW9_TRICX|nr:uncharacterized protein TNCV_4090211 [Trichonephila clavipes]
MSARTVRRRLQQYGLSAQRTWLWLPLTLHHRQERLQCLQNQDDRIHVWRHSGEHTLAACIRLRHTGPSHSMMVWGAIEYTFWSPLVRIDDEASFHLTGYVNTRNCRLDATENPLASQSETLLPAKVTVWYRFKASFIIGPYFFEETGAFGPVTVTGQRYECLLSNHVILDLQQRVCGNGIIFLQDGTPPLIANPVKQRQKGYFGNSRVISLHFPTAWLHQ